MISEIALVVVAGRESIAKAGQQIVKFDQTDSNFGAERNVDTSADDEIERIVAGRRAGAASTAFVV